MNELQFLFDTYKNTVYEKDMERFLSIFDKDVHVFDMWGQWSYQGLEAWRKMAKDWFGSLGTERVVIDFDEAKATVSGDMGVATATVPLRP
jgi:ketosteroid isomerase-like protein